MRWAGPQEGRILLLDVYQGLPGVPRGEVARLRIVAMPAKTQPTMNSPAIGVTTDDPGKCVLGTVPVEPDGSAHFRVPSGVPLFFQALDREGLAIQTMRSLTYVQPGQTLTCAGCHERRESAPPNRAAAAAQRAPSCITVGPEGSWPLRFDRLVQPVLDRHCIGCHTPGGDARAAQVDLSPARAYDTLIAYGKPSLYEHVRNVYRQGRSPIRGGAAYTSALLSLLRREGGHYGVRLSRNDLDRLVTWMDTYAQRLGSFSDEQEQRLRELRARWAGLLESPTENTQASIPRGTRIARPWR